MCRILVAGIAAPDEGDDAFGVAVTRRLARRREPPGVDVVDFAVGAVDLAFAAADGYDAVVLICDRLGGRGDGRLAVVGARLDGGSREAPPRPAGLDPRAILDLVHRLGGGTPLLLLVARAAREPADETADAVANLLRDLAVESTVPAERARELA